MVISIIPGIFIMILCTILSVRQYNAHIFGAQYACTSPRPNGNNLDDNDNNDINNDDSNDDYDTDDDDGDNDDNDINNDNNNDDDDTDDDDDDNNDGDNDNDDDDSVYLNTLQRGVL
jgi:hypothetical protein